MFIIPNNKDIQAEFDKHQYVYFMSHGVSYVGIKYHEKYKILIYSVTKKNGVKFVDQVGMSSLGVKYTDIGFGSTIYFVTDKEMREMLGRHNLACEWLTFRLVGSNGEVLKGK